MGTHVSDMHCRWLHQVKNEKVGIIDVDPENCCCFWTFTLVASTEVILVARPPSSLAPTMVSVVDAGRSTRTRPVVSMLMFIQVPRTSPRILRMLFSPTSVLLNSNQRRCVLSMFCLMNSSPKS